MPGEAAERLCQLGLGGWVGVHHVDVRKGHSWPREWHKRRHAHVRMPQASGAVRAAEHRAHGKECHEVKVDRSRWGRVFGRLQTLSCAWLFIFSSFLLDCQDSRLPYPFLSIREDAQHRVQEIKPVGAHWNAHCDAHSVFSPISHLHIKAETLICAQWVRIPSTPQSYLCTFLWCLTHFPDKAAPVPAACTGGAVSKAGRRQPKLPCPPWWGGNACFGERPFQPQAPQTPAFQGGQLAFLRVRVSIPEARLWLKKKIMFNLKIRNWSRLWAQGLIETKFKFLSSPFKHGGPS